MKSKFVFFVLALLICGVTYAVVQENSGAQNTSQQNTGSSNTMGSSSMSATGMTHTGTITKIDEKNHSITIRENSMGSMGNSGMSGSNPEETAGNPGSTTNPNDTGSTGSTGSTGNTGSSTGNTGNTGSSGTMGSSNAHSSHSSSMKGGTHTFKFNTATRFGTTDTSKGTGSISDLKVGDTVSFSTDNSGMITSISKQSR
jgi:Cu/Ag efflux protein CusF